MDSLILNSQSRIILIGLKLFFFCIFFSFCNKALMKLCTCLHIAWYEVHPCKAHLGKRDKPSTLRWSCYSLLRLGGPQLYYFEALPLTYGQYGVIELADKLYNSVTVCFLCFPNVYLSHRSQAGNEHGLGALQHPLWPPVKRRFRSFVWVHEFSSR